MRLGFHPAKTYPVVLTWKHMVHSGGLQRPLDVNDFHGTWAAQCKAQQGPCGAIATLYNLFLKAGSKDCGMQEKNPKDRDC